MLTLSFWDNQLTGQPEDKFLTRTEAQPDSRDRLYASYNTRPSTTRQGSGSIPPTTSYSKTGYFTYPPLGTAYQALPMHHNTPEVIKRLKTSLEVNVGSPDKLLQRDATVSDWATPARPKTSFPGQLPVKSSRRVSFIDEPQEQSAWGHLLGSSRRAYDNPGYTADSPDDQPPAAPQKDPFHLRHHAEYSSPGNLRVIRQPPFTPVNEANMEEYVGPVVGSRPKMLPHKYSGKNSWEEYFQHF